MGLRELQRRNEELFVAEHTLRRVRLHLADQLAKAVRFSAWQPYELPGLAVAYAAVVARLIDVMDEAAAIRAVLRRR